MEEVVIDFGDASTQVFHIGEASVAVPGLLAGPRGGARPARTASVAAALRPRARARPARRRARARAGVPPRDPRPDPSARSGRPQHLRHSGTHRRSRPRPDVDADPRRRAPRRSRCSSRTSPRTSPGTRSSHACRSTASIGGAVVLTMPAPSRGGAVVQAGLAVLDGRGDDVSGSISEARSLAAALAAGYAAAPPGASSGSRPTGTTNVSVVDGDGTAVALSSTLGSGSGVFRHGFQLNNMLGELDVIGEEPRDAGTRLPSMMAPTLVLADDEPRLVVGSAGLRSARGRDPPGRRRRRPPGAPRRGGDRPPAAPRRRRDRPHRGRLARRRRRGARGRRLRPGRLGGREPLLRRGLRGRAETERTSSARRATRGAAATDASSDDRDPSRRAGRRLRPGRTVDGGREGGGRVAADDRHLAEHRRRAPVPAHRSPPPRRGGLRRRRRRSDRRSAVGRPRSASRRAPTSPTSG